MNCPDLAPAIGLYRADELGSSKRQEMLSHLRECGECRRQAFEAEPSILFAVEDHPAEVPEDQVESILENVRIGIAIAETSRKLESTSAGRGKSRRLGALSAAALLLLSVSSPSRRNRSVIPASVARSIPAAAVPTAFQPEGDGGLLPASATIYEWNPATAAPNDPKIVWIVDRSLDL
jgi:tRNA(Met) C34 N-acetyltransferase TmcA